MTTILTAANTVESPTPLRPQRTCLGCRRKAAPKDLRRLALTEDANLKVAKIIFDLDGKKPGRGAWLCPQSGACLKALLKPGRLNRAFKTDKLLDISDLTKDQH